MKKITDENTKCRCCNSPIITSKDCGKQTVCDDCHKSLLRWRVVFFVLAGVIYGFSVTLLRNTGVPFGALYSALMVGILLLSGYKLAELVTKNISKKRKEKNKLEKTTEKESVSTKHTIQNKRKHLKLYCLIFSITALCVLLFFLIFFNFKGGYYKFAPPDSIEFKTIPSVVSPGKEAKLMIRGEPFTSYGITVKYSSEYSEADGLSEQITNKYGYANWYWRVGTNTISGTYPITVTNLETNYSETTYFTVE